MWVGDWLQMIGKSESWLAGQLEMSPAGVSLVTKKRRYLGHRKIRRLVSISHEVVGYKDMIDYDLICVEQETPAA